MAIIDRETVLRLFAELGGKLTTPTTLCIVGSTAAILLGQPQRQTPDIEVWEPQSDYDLGELSLACQQTGLVFDPVRELEAGAIYLQLLRPGVTMFPVRFEVERLGRFGNLTLVMPPPSLVVATKLGRGEDSDIEDAAWWVRTRALDHGTVAAAIDLIPIAHRREAAREKSVAGRVDCHEGAWRVTRSARQLRLEALDALLSDRVAAAFRARDWVLLEAIAEMAERDAPLDMAVADPAQFATLRAAITRFHLKGWSAMTAARVREVATSAEGRPRVTHQS